jgi:FkbM family methyltransferase
MSPRTFIKNIRRALVICPRWLDRLRWLRWQYCKDGRTRRIRFRYALPIGSLEVVVRSNQGSDAFIFGEVFDRRYYDFDLPRAPKTILDLGSNTGLTAVFFGRKYPHASIACVEPMPANFACLEENLVLNRVPAKTYQAAIAVQDGELQMDLCDKDYGHSVSGFGSFTKRGQLGVRAITVPTIMRELNWSQIDLLKVDIEGYECELLTKCADWLNCVNAIAIECHGRFGDDDLRSLAKRFGFSEPLRLRGIVLLLSATERRPEIG